MIKKFRLWLLGVWRWYRHRSLYVIADPADNSVTLSRALFEHMDVMRSTSGRSQGENKEQAKVFMFSVGDGSAGTGIYAFTLNPDIEQPTCLADIQYNSKHRSIGFESLCPTVNRIFYDYGLPYDRPVKLSVEPATIPWQGKTFTYYKILRPHDITAS
jgi:hypothetical protein